MTAFDDPRSSKTDWQAARSGRLYIVRFPEALELPDYFEQARPGALGVSLYTYRVKGVEAWCELISQRLQRDLIRSSSAQQSTDIITNEFGERSFSFIAPDGYFWTLIEL